MRGGIFSADHLALLVRTQKTSVSIRVHVCSKCKVYVSQRKRGSAVSFPRMSNRSVRPAEAPLPKPRATSCPEKSQFSGDRGAEQSETRFWGQETEAWMEKHILSHGATFRSLLACFGSLWFLDLPPEIPTNGERPPEDPPPPPRMCERSGPLASLRSDKTSTLTLYL